jgi:hypothetical protein
MNLVGRMKNYTIHVICECMKHQKALWLRVRSSPFSCSRLWWVEKVTFETWIHAHENPTSKCVWHCDQSSPCHASHIKVSITHWINKMWHGHPYQLMQHFDENCSTRPNWNVPIICFNLVHCSLVVHIIYLKQKRRCETSSWPFELLVMNISNDMFHILSTMQH